MRRSKKKFINYKVFGIPEMQNALYIYATDKQRAAALRKAGREAMNYAYRYAKQFCPVYNPSTDTTNFNDEKEAGALKQSIKKPRVRYNGIDITKSMFDSKGKLKSRYYNQLYVYVTAGNLKAGVDYAPRVEWGRNAYLQFIPYYNKDGQLDRKIIYIPAAPPQPFMNTAIRMAQGKIIVTFGQIYTSTLMKKIVSKIGKSTSAKVNKNAKNFAKQYRKGGK